MKLRLEIDTEKGIIDILKSDYNIIADTIYNDDLELTNNIVNFIKNNIDDNLEEIIK